MAVSYTHLDVYKRQNQDRLIIDDSRKNKGYIKVMGNHYGEVTIAPAVSKICLLYTS